MAESHKVLPPVRWSPVLAIFGTEDLRLQPVYVADVAETVLMALTTPSSHGKVYELGGARIYRYRALHRTSAPGNRPVSPAHTAAPFCLGSHGEAAAAEAPAFHRAASGLSLTAELGRPPTRSQFRPTASRTLHDLPLNKNQLTPVSYQGRPIWAAPINLPGRNRQAHPQRRFHPQHRFQEDAMSFDLSPLYRSTVGFDSLASILDQIADFDNEATTYPPYNIERLTENEYRITMAVAGFGKEDVKIEVNENTLSIRGKKKEADTERTFLHRGLASRAFERRFQLADYVEVRGADVRDGLLSVDLEREVPERLKPRIIEIGATVAKGNKTIDASVATN